jgi:putative DNA primase/helicase
MGQESSYVVMTGKHGDVPRFAASKLADELLNEAPAAKDGGGLLYAYYDDAWRPDASARYRKAVLDRMGDHWLPKHPNEVLQWIADNAPPLDERPPLDRVRVRNGIVRVGRTRVTLEPHSVEPMTPVHLPVTYDPDARCPEFDRYISTVLPSAQVRKTAQEVMGYVLVPDNSHQKAVLAKGTAGTGKTTWVRVLCALIGETNHSAWPLDAFSENRFAAADLYGKLANVCPDLSSRELSSSALFRSITGGDPIQAEHKGTRSFQFTPYARLIFAANQYPPVKSPTNALFDRWIVLPFDVRLRGTVQEDKTLAARLAKPDELSGILNYALEGLMRLRRQGGFTIAPESDAALDEFRLAADTVASFIRDQMSQPGFYERGGAHHAYLTWCEVAKHQPMSRNQFYGRVRELIGDEVKVKGANGWRVRPSQKEAERNALGGSRRRRVRRSERGR